MMDMVIPMLAADETACHQRDLDSKTLSLPIDHHNAAAMTDLPMSEVNFPGLTQGTRSECVEIFVGSVAGQQCTRHIRQEETN